MTSHADDWLSKPWMYVAPKSPELLSNWKDTWTKYILGFAQTRNIHLVNVVDLHREAPFNKLDFETFHVLITALLKAGCAKWWDKKAKLLRIYYRSIDSWVDHIENLTTANKTRIINGLDGLTTLEPSLAGVPEKEKQKILSILVERKSARWIKKKDYTVRILH